MITGRYTIKIPGSTAKRGQFSFFELAPPSALAGALLPLSIGSKAGRL